MEQTYPKSPGVGEWSAKKADLQKWLEALHGLAGVAPALVEMTTWTRPDGQTVRGKSRVLDLSDRQVEWMHPQIAQAYREMGQSKAQVDWTEFDNQLRQILRELSEQPDAEVAFKRIVWAACRQSLLDLPQDDVLQQVRRCLGTAAWELLVSARRRAEGGDA